MNETQQQLPWWLPVTTMVIVAVSRSCNLLRLDDWVYLNAAYYRSLL